MDKREWSTNGTTTVRVARYLKERLLKIGHYLDDNKDKNLDVQFIEREDEEDDFKKRIESLELQLQSLKEEKDV